MVWIVNCIQKRGQRITTENQLHAEQSNIAHAPGCTQSHNCKEKSHLKKALSRYVCPDKTGHWLHTVLRGKQIHLIPPTYKLLLSKYKENHYDFFCFIAFGSQLTLSCLLWLPANKKLMTKVSIKEFLGVSSSMNTKYLPLTHFFWLVCLS